MENLMRNLCVFLFITSGISSNAQLVSEKWESCFGGTEWDQGNSVIKIDNGYLVYGNTESSDGDIQGHHGLSDAWLIKIDTLGNLLWTKCYGGSKGEYGEEILSTDNSDFYLTGAGGSEDGDISYDPYPNSMDYWVVKVDSIGEIIWDRILGGTGIDWTRNAIVTDDGGIITLGISTSDDGDISNYYGGWDLWMVKLNSQGQKQWDMSLGGSGSESGASVKQTSDGGYIVAGSTDGYGGGNYDTACNHHFVGFMDAWVVKLDSLRNIEWQQCYGGTYHDGSKNILELDNGYLLLASTMSNDGDVIGFHGVAGNQEYGNDIWVIKLDFEGNIIWQNCLGGLHGDFARNIFTTSDGGFMVVGSTSSDDGDVEGYNGIDTGIYDDVWLAKLDSLGNLTWQYCYGGGGFEEMYRGVVQKSDFNYVITLGTNTDEWQCGGMMWPDLRIVELHDSTVGIKETSSNLINVKVSPNPARENIVFSYDLPEINENGSLMIFKPNGILINKINLENNKDKIRYNCSHLEVGIYFYYISFSGSYKTGKFIIVK